MRRRVVSPAGRLKIAAAQRRRRPMALTRVCRSVAPVEGHEPVFAPFAPNQLRCRACCRADKYNRAADQLHRRERNGRRVVA